MKIIKCLCITTLNANLPTESRALLCSWMGAGQEFEMFWLAVPCSQEGNSGVTQKLQLLCVLSPLLPCSGPPISHSSLARQLTLECHFSGLECKLVHQCKRNLCAPTPTHSACSIITGMIGSEGGGRGWQFNINTSQLGGTWE